MESLPIELQSFPGGRRPSWPDKNQQYETQISGVLVLTALSVNHAVFYFLLEVLFFGRYNWAVFMKHADMCRVGSREHSTRI